MRKLKHIKGFDKLNEELDISPGLRKLIEDILRECDIDPFTVDESDPKFINIYKLIHTWHIDKVYAKIHPYQPIH